MPNYPWSLEQTVGDTGVVDARVSCSAEDVSSQLGIRVFPIWDEYSGLNPFRTNTPSYKKLGDTTPWVINIAIPFDMMTE